MLNFCTLTNNQPINLVVLAENKAHNCHWFESIKVKKKYLLAAIRDKKARQYSIEVCPVIL
jgi:hypothetical protein